MFVGRMPLALRPFVQAERSPPMKPFPPLLTTLVNLSALTVGGGMMLPGRAAERLEGPRYLAFGSDRPGGAGRFDLYLYDRLNEALVPLPGVNSPLDDTHPSMTADANWIAFTSERHEAKPRRGGVFLYERSSGKVSEPPGVNGPTTVGTPAFNAKGDLLAYTRFDSPDLPPPGKSLPQSVFLLDREQKLPVLPNGVNPPEPSARLLTISGDGRWLAWEQNASGTPSPGPEIGLYDRKEGKRIAPPAQPAGQRGFPHFSQDGRLLAFCYRPTAAAAWEIAVVERESGRVLETPGLNSEAAEEFPNLSASGRYLAFESRRSGNWDLYLYDLRERRMVPLPGLNTPGKERHASLSGEG